MLNISGFVMFFFALETSGSKVVITADNSKKILSDKSSKKSSSTDHVKSASKKTNAASSASTGSQAQGEVTVPKRGPGRPPKAKPSTLDPKSKSIRSKIAKMPFTVGVMSRYVV